MANWVKYQNQNRINLDNLVCYGADRENRTRIWFDSQQRGDDNLLDYWTLEFEQEAQSILEWLDKIVGVREFGVREFKIQEPRPKKTYETRKETYEEPEMPF